MHVRGEAAPFGDQGGIAVIAKSPQDSLDRKALRLARIIHE